MVGDTTLGSIPAAIGETTGNVAPIADNDWGSNIACGAGCVANATAVAFAVLAAGAPFCGGGGPSPNAEPLALRRRRLLKDGELEKLLLFRRVRLWLGLWRREQPFSCLFCSLPRFFDRERERRLERERSLECDRPAREAFRGRAFRPANDFPDRDFRGCDFRRDRDFRDLRRDLDFRERERDRRALDSRDLDLRDCDRRGVFDLDLCRERSRDFRRERERRPFQEGGRLLERDVVRRAVEASSREPIGWGASSNDLERRRNPEDDDIHRAANEAPLPRVGGGAYLLTSASAQPAPFSMAAEHMVSVLPAAPYLTMPRPRTRRSSVAEASTALAAASAAAGDCAGAGDATKASRDDAADGERTLASWKPPSSAFVPSGISTDSAASTTTEP